MTTTAVSSIEEKLHSLCQAIVEDSEVQQARQQAEAFLADEQAVALYREVASTTHQFERRHQAGEKFSDEEIATFTSLRQRADEHPLIQGFHEAQHVLQEIATTVNAYVTKTLEKGAIPTEQEIAESQGGCCGGHGGGGCCSH